MRRAGRPLLIALFALVAAACGLKARGVAPDIASADAEDASVPFDASIADQTAPEDAAGDDASVDATADAAVDTGVDAGPTFVYDCDGTPVADCVTGCAGKPTGCIHCENSDPTIRKGTCLATTDGCYYNAPPSYGVCRCNNGDPGECPAFANQVCNSFDNGYCQPCGDRFSQDFVCRGGGTCDEASGACL